MRTAALPPRASAIPPAKSYASSSSNVRPRARGGGRGGGRSSVKYYREEEGGPPHTAEDGEGWDQEDQEFYEEMGDGWDWGCVEWRAPLSTCRRTTLAKPCRSDWVSTSSSAVTRHTTKWPPVGLLDGSQLHTPALRLSSQNHENVEPS